MKAARDKEQMGVVVPVKLLFTKLARSGIRSAACILQPFTSRVSMRGLFLCSPPPSIHTSPPYFIFKKAVNTREKWSKLHF